MNELVAAALHKVVPALRYGAAVHFLKQRVNRYDGKNARTIGLRHNRIKSWLQQDRCVSHRAWRRDRIDDAMM